MNEEMIHEEKNFFERMGRKCVDCGRAATRIRSEDQIRDMCYHCGKEVPLTVEECPIYSYGSKKRSFKSIRGINQIIDRELVYNLITEQENGMYAAYMAAQYILGARVSEIVREMKRFQILKEKDSLGREWMVFKNILTLKRRGNEDKHRRECPVLYEVDGKFLKIIDDYILHVPRDKVLFTFSRQYAYEIWKRYGLWTHLLRGLRALDLQQYYGWTMNQVRQYMGWANLNTAQHYLKEDFTRIMNVTQINKLITEFK